MFEQPSFLEEEMAEKAEPTAQFQVEILYQNHNAGSPSGQLAKSMSYTISDLKQLVLDEVGSSIKVAIYSKGKLTALYCGPTVQVVVKRLPAKGD